MKNLYHKLSLFSVLALVAFEPHNLQATSNNPDAEERQDSQKSQIYPAFKFFYDTVQNSALALATFQPQTLWATSNNPIQATVQKIKDGQFISDEFLRNCFKIPKEIKKFGLTITPDDPLFDSWINLILKTFPRDPAFGADLISAIERGKNNEATPIAQYNLGLIYDKGYDVDRNSRIAYVFYEKAADRGYADAQYILGSMCNLFDEYSDKSLEWYTKAADQGHAAAQLRLALMYGIGGEIVKQDLAQSLKWFLESCKSDFFYPDPYPKEFIDFIPLSPKPENEINPTADQNTLKNNIKAFLGFHDTEKGINNPDLNFEEHEWAILNLVKNYQEIIDFKGALLKALDGFQQSGFMVNCLKVKDKDIETFKSSRSTDIKYYKFQDQSFLTFGQDNIKVADMLMTIFDTAHPVYGEISHILDVLKEVQQSFETKNQFSDLAEKLRTQYESRVRLELENQSLDPMKTLTRHKALVEKVEQEIEILKQLQAIPQKLQDLLIEGAPVRNNLFLQNNKHIEIHLKD